jgi:hypothetical protein
LHLAGLRGGTTVQGTVASRDAQLTLEVAARDPMIPLPLLITLLGLVIGTLVLLLSPDRLAPALRRWSLYAKLDQNSHATQSGQPAILGISRETLRSWKGADGRPLTHDAVFVDCALKVLDDGPSRLINLRKMLAQKIESSERLKDTPLLNKASAEASNTRAVWSDFFDGMGKPRAKLPPQQELDRLTLANELLDDLDYLDRDLRPETPDQTRMKLKYLRAEIGRAGKASDIDRALAAVEDDTKRLRWEIISNIDAPNLAITGHYAMTPAYADAPAYPDTGDYPRRRGCSIVVVSFLILASLAAALFVTGRLKITTPAGAVVAGAFVAIPLLFVLGWAVLKLAPYALSLLRYVYQRLFLPLARNAILRLRVWRYALLRDFVTAIVVVALLVLGVTIVLVTTYGGREAFGKPLDYLALGAAATGASIVAVAGGYFTNRFRKPSSGAKQ